MSSEHFNQVRCLCVRIINQNVTNVHVYSIFNNFIPRFTQCAKMEIVYQVHIGLLVIGQHNKLAQQSCEAWKCGETHHNEQ